MKSQQTPIERVIPGRTEPIEFAPFAADFDIDAAFKSETELYGEPQVPAAKAAIEPPKEQPAELTTLSVAELIENHVRLDWGEAVAIALRLCQTMAPEPAANAPRSSVEPWNVEITDTGEVRVLPGGTSADPVVKQVGRVLRALLQDTKAPAELRLVAAQASFEVPVYASLDELAKALRHFERTTETDPILAAFHRGMEARFGPLQSTEIVRRLPELTMEQWAPAPPVPLPMPPRDHVVLKRAATMVFAATLVIAATLFVRSLPGVGENPPAAAAAPAVAAAAPASRVARAEPPAPVEPPAAVAPPVSAPVSPPTRPAPVSPPAVRETAVVRSSAPRAAPPVPRQPVPPRPSAPSRTSSPAAAIVTRGAVAAEPPQLSERRAAALLAAGRVEEASLVFDSIVLRYPLYRLDPAQSSPAALAAFQQSKRSLLPGLARAHVDNAEAAIAAGEFAAAIAETDRAARMVEDADIAPAPLDLSMAIHSARTRAVAGKTTLEQRVYTADDRDVIPPAPVGRQLPQAAPVGGGPIGRLEILVDRAGRVEAVKLHTPSNAYHDRMIVSAAKAWHFKPATRAGKPVRFTLIMSINLPGSD